jgi:hypothetical protein
MGTLAINHATYDVDSRALSCLPEVLTALLRMRPYIDVTLTFSDGDVEIRINTSSPLIIEVEHELPSYEDDAGLLTSEYLMMGRLHLSGIGAAPTAR